MNAASDAEADSASSAASLHELAEHGTAEQLQQAIELHGDAGLRATDAEGKLPLHRAAQSN
eukprot:COSAG06_NODE_19215_length_848_cov_12.942590_1_plen_60_part_01